MDYALNFSELSKDTPQARACLQRNEDKIEEFTKWSENMVRFVRSILEEAERMSQLLPSLEIQIGKFSNFEEAFGVHKTVEALETITNLLKNTQSSNHKLVSNIADRMLVPLQEYFQQDVKALKDSRKTFERSADRHESSISRYLSLSKFKDVLELDGELAQLYDTRIGYYENCFDHAARIKNFKQVIDLFFLEKIASLIDELSEFFKTLSDNFLSVKTQMDQVRGEYDKLSREAQKQRLAVEEEKSQHLAKIRNRWDASAPIAHQLSAQKQGHLYLRRRKALGNPWKRVYATIEDGHFSFEYVGRTRGSIESGESLNLMLCDIRPIEMNERRFCFEIYAASQQSSLVLQSESEDDMMDWVNTFHTAKTDLVELKKQPVKEAPEPAIKVCEEPESVSVFNYGSHLVLKKWNEELRRHFEIGSEEEVTLCSFPASLHTDIWTQGRVFVTQYSVYFFSSLFGIGKKIIIPLRDVMKIDIVQSSFVTLVNFTMSGEAKDFTLKTFNTVDDSNDRFIQHLQRLHRNTQSAEPKSTKMLFTEMQHDLNELEKSMIMSAEISEEAVIVSTSEAAIVSPSEAAIVSPSEAAIVSPSTLPSTGSPASASSLIINEAAPLQHVQNSNTVKTEDLSKEVPCGCTSHMDKRQVNTVIPIDCAVAFDLMFGPLCPVQHAVQARRKNRNYKITDWKVNAEGIQERNESYMFPLNNPLVRMKETECYVNIKLSKNQPGKCYVIDCQTSTPNIPYADAFYTKTRYCINRAGQDQTRISISLGIVWLKSPFVKSIIKSATLKTFTEFCADYMLCLRAEIGKKIGSGSGEAAALEAMPGEEAVGIDGGVVDGTEGTPDSAFKATNARQFMQNLISTAVQPITAFPLISTIGAFLVAFLLGASFRPRVVRQIISSSDLEAKVKQSLSVSSSSFPAHPPTWKSSKFARSHARLHQLHPEFTDIRHSLLVTLERLNDLERRIYHAESVAVLGDQLLSCLERDGLDCKDLLTQWKRITEK